MRTTGVGNKDGVSIRVRGMIRVRVSNSVSISWRVGVSNWVRLVLWFHYKIGPVKSLGFSSEPWPLTSVLRVH